MFSMNSCLEKFVGFIRIMSDGLDGIVACSNSIKIAQKNAPFSYFTKLYKYSGNFQSS